jgi:biotin operon repressor
MNKSLTSEDMSVLSFMRRNVYGWENRYCIFDLTVMLTMSNRKVRKIFENLKAHGYMICADPEGGYFLLDPENEIDIELGIKYYNSMRNRAKHCFISARPFETLIPKGQLKFKFKETA